MNQLAIGQYITKKRKEKNLTQEQLSEKLGVSNKTISKWENGKCMPNYDTIKSLCKELGISVSELMDGEDADKNSVRLHDETQIMELIRRIQQLETEKNTMYGVLLVVMGIAMLAVSKTIGGSDFKDFISGLLLGLSVGEMLVGVYCMGRCFLRH